MPELIRNRLVARDTYVRVESLDDVADIADILVSPALLATHRETLKTRSGKLGVWLETSDVLEPILEDLPRLDLVAVHFPSFTDGRGHTLGRALRSVYRFQGEIRATGDVFRETLFYLSRCGFDGFVLREGEHAEEALSGLEVFSEAYQTSTERPQPLFRRRLKAIGTSGQSS